MKFLGRDLQLYKDDLNDHIQVTGDVFEKSIAKDIINGNKDLKGRGVLKKNIA